MMILVINAGSSSLKYQLIDMRSEEVLAKGLCERIGIGGSITHKTPKGKAEYEVNFPSHKEAFKELMKALTTGELAVISDMNEIKAIGHRVVQGGEKYSASTMVNKDSLEAVEFFSDLAPLHNPANLMAIRACMDVFDKSVPQVMVFDTAFHQTLPQHAYIYSIPYEMYEKHRIRRYGYHGTSHRYVSGRLAEIMGKPLEELKVVTCHLGNGSSITAVDSGKSIDTTMGMTPLEGMSMGTRSGTIDPSIIPFLIDKENLTSKEVTDMLNKRSGYLGISGLTSDMRDLEAAAAKGHERAALAMSIMRYQLRKYIGSFAAAMGGVDAVVFTGGIGENDAQTRSAACEGLGFMGIVLDEEVNNGCRSSETEISTPDSKVKVFVIPTNEELLIARDTKMTAGV